MPIKKCPNGHTYDPNVYAQCPFCPPSAGGRDANDSDKTFGYGTQPPTDDRPTQFMSSAGNPNDGADSDKTVLIPKNEGPFDEPKTKIHQTTTTNAEGKRSANSKKLVAVLSTYSKAVDENGEVFKLYEGKTAIGRDDDCGIVIKGDDEVSSKHVIILCRNIEGQPLKFFLKDNMSTNGTFLNGKIEDEQVELKSFDVIRIGSTELTFIALVH